MRDLSEADEATMISLSHLFDGPARPDASRRFANERGHHLLVAFVDDEPAGFVSGVEVTQPDKGTEMLLYELGVDEAHRRRGIGAALTRALEAKARALGCVGMWVLTDDDNDAALATYRAAGADEESRHVMFGWSFDA
jgi:ribosomal protein S18 acetylase RimI-like enzyme